MTEVCIETIRAVRPDLDIIDILPYSRVDDGPYMRSFRLANGHLAMLRVP